MTGDHLPHRLTTLAAAQMIANGQSPEDKLAPEHWVHWLERMQKLGPTPMGKRPYGFCYPNGVEWQYDAASDLWRRGRFAFDGTFTPSSLSLRESLQKVVEALR